MIHEFFGPKKLIAGENSIDLVPNEIKALNKANPLIVTDAGIVERGVLRRLISPLDEARMSYKVFSDVEPDPSMEVMDKGGQVCREGKHDCIIALGGGSSIDAAKAISVVATNKGAVRNYLGIGAVYKQDPLPVIAIPTTAGTGSEVTLVAVVSDKKNKVKLGMKSPKLMPVAAVLDPTLLSSLPPRLIASTGLDAFTHALESFMSIRSSIMTRELSLDAARMIFDSVIPFRDNPKDMELGLKMLYGSFLAGLAFTNGGVGAMHALAHSIGSQYHVAHGVACGLFVTRVLRENMDAALDRYGAFLAGLGYETKGLSATACAEKLIEVMDEFLRKLEIPATLTAMGIKLEVLPEMITAIMKDPPLMANPKKYDEETIRRLLESAR
ncbi:MAG: alcohol dehydrogenase [Deltaproteobacteria bacterium]|nr:alcohol dehydrogenase [Deltaproteobacteria bacterium]